MPDTIKTRDQLVASFPSSGLNEVSAQRLRNFLKSTPLRENDGDPATVQEIINAATLAAVPSGLSWEIILRGDEGRFIASGVTIDGESGFLNSSNSASFASVDVNDDIYDATAWNGSVQVPTKNAVRDKVESVLSVAELVSRKGQNNGYASLDSGGKIPQAQMPAVALVTYLGSVASQGAMLALTGQSGDWCIRSDVSKVFFITGSDPTQVGSWTAVVYPASPVTSVASRVGDVTLSNTDISGLGSAALISSTAGGDLSGTLPSPTVVKINGVSMAGLATGLLKNTTATGAPSIAVAGTDYVAVTGTAIVSNKQFVSTNTAIDGSTGNNDPCFRANRTVSGNDALLHFTHDDTVIAIQNSIAISGYSSFASNVVINTPSGHHQNHYNFVQGNWTVNGPGILDGSAFMSMTAPAGSGIITDLTCIDAGDMTARSTNPAKFLHMNNNTVKSRPTMDSNIGPLTAGWSTNLTRFSDFQFAAPNGTYGTMTLMGLGTPVDNAGDTTAYGTYISGVGPRMSFVGMHTTTNTNFAEYAWCGGYKFNSTSGDLKGGFRIASNDGSNVAAGQNQLDFNYRGDLSITSGAWDILFNGAMVFPAFTWNADGTLIQGIGGNIVLGHAATTTAGGIWFDSGANAFKCRDNSATKTFTIA